MSPSPAQHLKEQVVVVGLPLRARGSHERQEAAFCSSGAELRAPSDAQLQYAGGLVSSSPLLQIG